MEKIRSRAEKNFVDLRELAFLVQFGPDFDPNLSEEEVVLIPPDILDRLFEYESEIPLLNDVILNYINDNSLPINKKLQYIKNIFKIYGPEEIAQNTLSDFINSNKFGLPNSEQIINLLIANGADPNTQNDLGVTPLMMAVSSGNLDFTQNLLDNEANPNIQADGFENRTALHMVLKPIPEFDQEHENKFDLAHCLVVYGADTSIYDDNFQTANDIARELDETDLAEYIY